MKNSSEELVDVLNDAGNIIGVTTRRDVRARRLPHRCVYVLVFDSRGRLYIHQRTSTKDIYPSYWDICVGGVLTSGEAFDEGARRETLEEIGVDVAPSPLFPFRFADTHTIVHAKVYQVRHDGPFRLQPEEVACGEFIDQKELLVRTAQVPFCPDGLEVWAEYQRLGLTPG